MQSYDVKPEHQALWEDLTEVIQKHSKVGGQEILAILSQMVGQVIAMQDSNVITVKIAMEIVHRNMMVGNESAIQLMQGPEGSA